MAKTLQFRRGTTSELNTVTGSVGELFVNTEKDTIVVMDGSTCGGFELTQNNATQTLTNKTLTSPVISTISNTGTLTLPTSTGTIALTSDIPTNNNVLTNGAGYITAGSCDCLTNKTIDFPTICKATLCSLIYDCNNNCGVNGQFLKSSGSGVVWSTITDNDTNTTYNTLVIDSGDDAIIRLSGSDASSSDIKLVAGSNITISPGTGDTITIASTASGGSADLSAISEDVLPGFDSIYDLGSTTTRWYDSFLSNSLNIAGASLTGNSTGFVTDTILIGDVLHTSNTLTPDASTAIQYGGDQGVVDINGNLDVSTGDWLLPATVETATVTVDTVQTVDKIIENININRFGRIYSSPPVFGSYVGTQDGTEANPLAIVFSDTQQSRAERDYWVDAWNTIPIGTEILIWNNNYGAYSKLRIIKKRDLNPSGFDANVWLVNDWKNNAYSVNTDRNIFTRNDVGAVILFNNKDFTIVQDTFENSYGQTYSYTDTWNFLGDSNNLDSIYQYVSQSQLRTSVSYTWQETSGTLSETTVTPSSVGLEGMLRYNKDESALQVYNTAWKNIPYSSDLSSSSPTVNLITDDNINQLTQLTPGSVYMMSFATDQSSTTIAIPDGTVIGQSITIYKSFDGSSSYPAFSGNIKGNLAFMSSNVVNVYVWDGSNWRRSDSI